jgi:hypothetical protein
LQNSPLESSCVVFALIENYSTSKRLKISPEKSQILSCDTVVENERYMHFNYNISGVAKFENQRCGSDGRDKKCIQIFGTEAY